MRHKKRFNAEGEYELWQISDPYLKGDTNVVGYLIADKHTLKPIIQIAHCNTGWQVIEVVHAEPFEFVDLGSYPSQASAFECADRCLLDKEQIQTNKEKQ